jgi:triosephosphate isomerase
MRRKLVAGNWKMHGSRTGNLALLEEIFARVESIESVDVLVCPPTVFLSDVATMLQGRSNELRIALGAQDVSAEVGVGAFTGEVSAQMLREIGAAAVIVGHSERRSRHGESDALVARKFAATLEAALLPILCVGEQLAEREAGQTELVVARQLEAVIEHCGVDGLARGVIAYEPVWAIGTGRTATPEQAEAVHAFIRGRIAAHDATIGGSMRILYGGSVKAGNARDLFAQPDVDGGLIGGASLDAKEFAAVIAAAK